MNQSIPNSLSDILKLEKIKHLSPQEIEYLWISKTSIEEHNEESSFVRKLPTAKIGSVIRTETFKRIEKLAKKNKQFILPVQNEQLKQLEIHYLQWQTPMDAQGKTLQLIITKLADFQRLGQSAEAHTVIYFFKDLQEAALKEEEKEVSLNKGLVLMKGEILNSSSITVKQLEFLLLNVQKFYGALDQDNIQLKNERLKMLLSFNSGDSSFSFDRLIELAMNTR